MKKTTLPAFAFFGQLPFVAAMAHVGWAALTVLFVAHWWGVVNPVIAVITFAAVKEFWIDAASWFEADSYLDGVIDFAEYAGGCVLGVGLFYLQRLS